MLPFDKKPWAATVAGAVIVTTILGISAAALYLHTLGPLDTGEIVAMFLLALAIIPTNLAVIYRHSTHHPAINSPVQRHI